MAERIEKATNNAADTVENLTRGNFFIAIGMKGSM